MPGGGIREENVATLLQRSGAREFHVSASVSRTSQMTFRNPKVSMGQSTSATEYEWRETSAERVRAFRQQAQLAMV